MRPRGLSEVLLQCRPSAARALQHVNEKKGGRRVEIGAPHLAQPPARASRKRSSLLPLAARMLREIAFELDERV